MRNTLHIQISYSGAGALTGSAIYVQATALALFFKKGPNVTYLCLSPHSTTLELID